MLPIFLVLLVAQGALCAPAVIQVTGVSVNDVASDSLTDAAFSGLLDNGESSFNTINAQSIINDIIKSQDNYYQATAAGQAINLLAEHAVGTAGDSCDYATYVNAVAADNGRSALAQYVNRLLNNIDIIVNLAVNPNGARYARGPTGGCSGGGRSWNLEGAWEQLLEDADIDTVGLLNEEYCVVKRLANSVHARDSNVGAGITAAAIGPAVQVIELSLVPALNFLNAIASGGDPSGAGAALKSAIQAASSRL